MRPEPNSKPELQDLLAQLARFISANESRLSAAHVSKCFRHLSAIEVSALHRLLLLLYQTETMVGLPHNATFRLAAQGIGGDSRFTQGFPPGLYDSQWPERECRNTPSHHHSPRRRLYCGSTSTNDNYAPRLHRGTDSGDLTTLRSAETNRASTSNLHHSSDQVASSLQPTSTLPIVASTQASTQADGNHLHRVASDEDRSCSRTRLSTCIEIKPTQSTESLLESCKADPGMFLRAIKKAKIVLPDGQGWEAAIATKKENADVRDVLRIYHRFECYNIYSHVVEAGFHTGTHWVRQKRSELIKKLCQDFPDRFQSEKAANQGLNWVDQGFRYREWTEIFTGTTDLGYLIALPSEVPHSAYTTRCTKEQMIEAAAKFKELGICGFVEDLELSALGNHIAATLKDMTIRKRAHVDEETPQSSRKSMRLMLPSSRRVITAQAAQNLTTLEPATVITGGNAMSFASSPMDNDIVGPGGGPSFDEFIFSELSMDQLATSSSQIEEWYHHFINGTEH